MSLGGGWGEVKLAPGKHAIRFANQVHSLPESQAQFASPDPIVASNAVEIEIVASNEAPAAAAVSWGAPVKGVVVSLRSDHFAWTADDAVTFRASLHNGGAPTLSIAQSQELGELELDGVWYRWAGDIDVKNSVFLPGRQYDDIPITLTAHWRTKGGQPFHLTLGRHVVRFAATIEPANSAAKPAAFRAVSNPVEINVEPAIGVRAALVKKYLPGCELRTVRRQTAAQESLQEVLTRPSGEEVDLASIRQSWTGAVGDMDFYWHSPKLAAVVPLLRVKIAAAQGAEDVARIVLGVFRGAGTFEDCSFKAEPCERGWLVTVGGRGPMELIMAEGVFQDARDWLDGPKNRAGGAGTAEGKNGRMGSARLSPYSGFAALPETTKDRIVWELDERHEWGLPEQEPICRDLLIHQGYSFANSIAWTIAAIDLAGKQQWKDLSPLITRIYERPRNIWVYERAFRYLRSQAGKPVSAKLIADMETLRAAGFYESDVSDSQLSAAKGRLATETDKDAVLVYAVKVAGWHAGKGGSDRGREAAGDVLKSLDREVVVKRIRQLHEDGDELSRSEIEWVAEYLHVDMEASVKGSPGGSR